MQNQKQLYINISPNALPELTKTEFAHAKIRHLEETASKARRTVQSLLHQTEPNVASLYCLFSLLVS